METENKLQYLGKGIDATNREVEVYRDGNDIIAKYKNSHHEARIPITEIQAKTFEELLWTPFAAFKAKIDAM